MSIFTKLETLAAGLLLLASVGCTKKRDSAPTPSGTASAAQPVAQEVELLNVQL
ncbi:MAG: hypothetical protein QM784_04475 [Polyangiaceae bacterium]